MALHDVHAHLTHPDLLPNVETLLTRCQEAGVTRIVSNGLNPEDNQRVLDLAARSPLVKPALGLYPVDAVLKAMLAAGVEYPDRGRTYETDEAVDWVRKHADQAFAIGEIGLDGYWVPEQFWPEQERAFCELVDVARIHDKPIIIHTRKREARTFELLQENGYAKVNWHCFGGRVKLARRIAEAGHYLSIPANARRSASFTRMLETLPREQMLLETDSPYLGPEKGQLNEPSNVRKTMEYAAETWGVSAEEAEAQFAANFDRLFPAAN